MVAHDIVMVPHGNVMWLMGNWDMMMTNEDVIMVAHGDVMLTQW